MPFSSGTYSAPSSPGSFNPAISGQQATATTWNALLLDLSSSLSTAILKDGTQTVAANIPFNSKKITGLGNATLGTDAVNAGQVVGGTLSGVNDTGAADAYVIAPAIAITSYVAYQSFQFKAANTNTGASTIAVSSMAAKAIKHLDGTALLAGDIIAGEIVDVTYDGTNFQLLSSTGMRGTANTWRATQNFSAAVNFLLTATMSGAAFNEAIRVDVASATTTDIGAAVANYVRITGTTTITGLGTIASGVRRKVVFAGILILTHNATSLILPNAGSNITTAAGDTAEFESEGSGNWRCTDYQRASGAALVGYTAPQSAYLYATLAAGVVTTQKSSGLSISRTGAGTFTCTLSPVMPDANYRVLATTAATLTPPQQGEWVFEDTAAGSRTTATFYLQSRGDNTGAQDPDAINIQVFA